MSPGPSHQREQQERKEALANDRKLRPGEHEPSTMFAMANLDTGVTPRACRFRLLCRPGMVCPAVS